MAKNGWVKVSATVRWLGHPSDVKAHHAEGAIEASSITFPVVGEATFGSLQKSQLRLLGRRYRDKAFEQERLDAQCGRCGKWGHIEARCTEMLVALCRTAASHRPTQVPRQGVLIRQERGARARR